MFSSYKSIFIPALVLIILANQTEKSYAQQVQLDKLYVFGEKSSPKNYGGYGRADDQFRDQFVGDISAVPSILSPDLSTKGLSASQTTGSALNSESGGEEVAVNAGRNYVPNHPLDNIPLFNGNKPVVQNWARQSPFFFVNYAARNADPAAAEGFQDAFDHGAGLSNTVTQASNHYEEQLKNSGANGQAALMGYEYCLNKVQEGIKAGAVTEETQQPAYSQCLNNIGMVNGGSGGIAGLPRSATNSNSFVARSGVNTRATQPGAIDEVMLKCGFPSSGLPPEASCEGNISGGKALASVSLSYLLYPIDPSGRSTNQDLLRKEFKDAFGDKCYVCMSGGTTSLNQKVADGVVHRVTLDIPPGKKLLERFNEVNETVYEALRTILKTKCIKDNAPAGGTGGSQADVNTIFHLKGSNGEVADSWDDGNFWRSSAANGQDGSANLLGGISIIKALDYLSFNGFRLTPSVMDAMYYIMTEKENISEVSSSGDLQGPGIGIVSNSQCDKRLGDTAAKYTTIKQALAKDGAAAPVKREIKALFKFAQRLALGKVFDACGQVLSKVNQVKIPPDMAQEASQSIMKVCSGDVNDQTAYMKNQADNLSSLNEFISKLYQEISISSGKSGAGVAKAFKGDKNLAAQGNLR